MIETLNEVVKINVLIECKTEEIEHLRSLRESITTKIKDDVVSGGGGEQDKLGELTARIIDLENELLEDVHHMCELHKQADKMLLDVCEDPKEYALMHKRYMSGWSFDRIGKEMGYSRQWVNKLHEKILQRINGLVVNS